MSEDTEETAQQAQDYFDNMARDTLTEQERLVTNEQHAALQMGDRLAQAPNGRVYILRSPGYMGSVSILTLYGYPITTVVSLGEARAWVQESPQREVENQEAFLREWEQGDKHGGDR